MSQAVTVAFDSLLKSVSDSMGEIGLEFGIRMAEGDPTDAAHIHYKLQRVSSLRQDIVSLKEQYDRVLKGDFERDKSFASDSSNSTADHRSRTKLAKGTYTSSATYAPYLLRAMLSVPMPRTWVAIVNKTIHLMKQDNILKPADMEKLESGTYRYYAQVCTTRQTLIRQGFVTSSKEGHKLTDRGINAALRLLKTNDNNTRAAL